MITAGQGPSPTGTQSAAGQIPSADSISTERCVMVTPSYSVLGPYRHADRRDHRPVKSQGLGGYLGGCQKAGTDIGEPRWEMTTANPCPYPDESMPRRLTFSHCWPTRTGIQSSMAPGCCGRVPTIGPSLASGTYSSRRCT